MKVKNQIFSLLIALLVVAPLWLTARNNEANADNIKTVNLVKDTVNVTENNPAAVVNDSTAAEDSAEVAENIDDDNLAVYQSGKATYYAERFHGRRTSSGERFNMNAYTCAHRTLPFGTKLKVTNLRNNKSVVVRVTDRGPFGRGKIIDLSKAAARDIDMLHAGVANVKIQLLDKDTKVKEPEIALASSDVEKATNAVKSTKKYRKSSRRR